MTVGTVTVDAVLREHGLGRCTSVLGEYIARQRWSGAQGSAVQHVSVEDAAVLIESDSAVVLFAVVAVAFTDGRESRYALPLGTRPTGDPLAERAPLFLIAAGVEDLPDRFLYDAVGDPDYIHRLWRAIRDEATLPTARGRLRCSARMPDRLEPSIAPSLRVLTVEQSNTSFELGEATFLKHQRRIEPGSTQELEMATALTDGGFEHVPPVLATVTYESEDGPTAPLVIVQPFLRNSSDGWLLALTSLRDLYADAEEALATGNRDVQEVVAGQGGAFLGEAERLGAVIADMHLTLARATAPGMAGRPVGAEMLAAWASGMEEDLDRLLAQAGTSLDPLRAHADVLRRKLGAVRALPSGSRAIRIHGDLHLGQCLRVDSGWVILDFEGEPDRSPEERRRLASPLRDVAGMLRSFDYAAAVALTERLMPESADWEGLMAFGDEWSRQNRDAFWRAYSARVDGAELLPPQDAAATLLRALELQKAVYETAYEIGHRPSWVTIPLRFLLSAANAGD